MRMLPLNWTEPAVAARGSVLSARAANYLLLLAGLAPIALVWWYVVTQGTGVPWGDQWWGPVYIAVKTQTGTLTLNDFFVLDWGHRAAVTRLIIAISTIVTHYDAGPLRFAAFVLTLLNLGLTLVLLRPRRTLIPISFCLFAILLFSPYYPPNWLDICYSAWQQAFFFMLLGLLVLQRMHPGWPAFLLLIFCATAASFAYASGLAAWISLPIAAAGIVEYRRRPYLMLWLLVLALCLIFYASNYAAPLRSEEDSISLSRVLEDGFISPLLYLFRFLAVRFNTNHILAIGFTILSSLVLGMNLWRIMHSKDGAATAALWGAMAMYTIAGAALILLGRGPLLVHRYAPGSDGFWLAFIGSSLLVFAQRPRLHVALLNGSLLLALVAGSVRTDIRALRALTNLHGTQTCDESIANYPLFRDDSFHKCNIWSEDQSVYHLAALRLSVFRDEMPQMILPRADAPVITDMPNRWLSVYVRDYMLAGLPWQNLHSIAPVPGVWPQYAEPYNSPYNRGEWSTDILAHPLRQTWTSATELASHLSILTLDQPLLWYLNTPETEANFSIIEQALAELGYTAVKFPIRAARYATARFGLWCFERRETGACAVHVRFPPGTDLHSQRARP